MQLTRLTNIFQLTTAPQVPTAAVAHTGGWSESFWTALGPNAYNPLWGTQQTKRALLLPAQAAIVGYRSALYNLTGNKILPLGTATGAQLKPGVSGILCDLPQVSLECSAGGAGVPNTSRLVLRGMPDTLMVGGEFAPPTFYLSYLTQFFNSLIGNNFGFIGRDLTQPSFRVLSLAAGVLKADANLPAYSIGDYIRWHRVIDASGEPVIGTAIVTAVPAGASVTISDLTTVISKPSGTFRKDALQYFNYSEIVYSRAVVKKIGRPLQGYRGRRSKRRA